MRSTKTQGAGGEAAALLCPRVTQILHHKVVNYDYFHQNLQLIPVKMLNNGNNHKIQQVSYVNHSRSNFNYFY